MLKCLVVVCLACLSLLQLCSAVPQTGAETKYLECLKTLQDSAHLLLTVQSEERETHLLIDILDKLQCMKEAEIEKERNAES